MSDLLECRRLGILEHRWSSTEARDDIEAGHFQKAA